MFSCQRFGLNSYVYAPKDDAKHRSRWRDLYDEDESNELARLIRSSKGKQVKFIYALSPGLDISCSSDDDWEALKKKFDQVRRRRRDECTTTPSFSLVN